MTSYWLTPNVSSLEFIVFFMSDDERGDTLNFVPLLFPQRSEYEQTVCLSTDRFRQSFVYAMSKDA